MRPRPQLLASQVVKTAAAPNGMRTGTVTAIDATGVTVNIAGGDVLCGVVGSTAGIAVGMTVAVFRQNSSWMVQGAVNGAGNSITNSVILGGAQISNQGATLASGITTGSGEVYSNVLVTTAAGVVVPKNHYIQVVMMVNTSTTIASAQIGARIRVGSGTGGTQIGSGHNFGPTSGFTYELKAEGWIIGDGNPASYGLTVQNFTGGSLTVTSSAIAPGICAIFDWGDATGVTFI